MELKSGVKLLERFLLFALIAIIVLFIFVLNFIK